MSEVAAIQMQSEPDVEHNLAQAGRLLAEAAQAGALLAVLPENFAFMGTNDEQRLAAAESADDPDAPIQSFLAAQARTLGLWIVGGTVPLRTDEPDRVASACLVYDDSGCRVARYDKVHMFDVSVPGRQERYRESRSTVPGRELVVLQSPVGRLGLAVCYDLRFPELFRKLVDKGAEILAVPAAFTAATGRAHWQVLVRARAIENLCHVIAAPQAGHHAGGRETWGDAMIVDHWGTILKRLPMGAGVCSAAVDLDAQSQTRAIFPALEHRVFRVQ